MAPRMDSLFGSLETSGFIATYPTQRPSADRPLLTGSSYSAGQALRPSTVRRSSVASQNGRNGRLAGGFAVGHESCSVPAAGLDHEIYPGQFRVYVEPG